VAGLHLERKVEMSREISKSAEHVLRGCDKCAFDIDVYSRVECDMHKLHYFKIGNEVFDMCCLCGIDADYLDK
jgi:hypothetical protein